MLKSQELSDPDSTWNKTDPDEPVFILCGRDPRAPRVVAAWIEQAEQAGLPREKINRATALFALMSIWQLRNPFRMSRPEIDEETPSVKLVNLIHLPINVADPEYSEYEVYLGRCASGRPVARIVIPADLDKGAAVKKIKETLEGWNYQLAEG